MGRRAGGLKAGFSVVPAGRYGTPRRDLEELIADAGEMKRGPVLTSQDV